MKTSIYNTIALMITAMFICTLLVATRKSRGLSSWLPRNVTSNLVTRPPGPARRSWHIGTLEVVSRNEFYRMDFTLSIIIPPASTKLKGGYTGITLSVCPSVDRIVSALYLQQYPSDPFHICTSYQATSEGVSRVMPEILAIFLNL